MSATFDLAEAIVKFTACTETNWDNFNLPIPENVIIVSADTKKFKRGDGIHLYKDLQDGPTIAEIASNEDTAVNVLSLLTEINTNDIIIINNEIYSASGSKIENIIGRISAIQNKDVIQDSNLNVIEQQVVLANSIVDGKDGCIGIISNGKLTAGPLPEDIVSSDQTKPLFITDFNIYVDSELTTIADQIFDQETYYVSINASHDSADIDNLIYQLSSSINVNVDITLVRRGLFRIDIGDQFENKVFEFTATVAYNVDTVTVTKTVVVNHINVLTTSVYIGSSNDKFESIAVDSVGNIFAVGSSKSTGTTGQYDCFIAKFDSSLNMVAQKLYGGTVDDYFHDIAVDTFDNVYAVGKTFSEGPSATSLPTALIVKFDNNLNPLIKKIYGGANSDEFRGIAIDSNNNIYAVGNSFSTNPIGHAGDALIVKFNVSLSIVSSKILSGSSYDYFSAIAIDQNGYLFIGGNTASEEALTNKFLITKFDSSLTLLASKVYGSTSANDIKKITIDDLGDIYAVGEYYVSSILNAIIFKFDNDLNIITSRVFYEGVASSFSAVFIDNDDNIEAFGYTSSEGVLTSALIVKFDSSLNTLSRNYYGSAANDAFNGVITFGNMVYIVGVTNDDFLICKMSKDIPNGSFSGNIGLTLNNSTIDAEIINAAFVDSVSLNLYDGLDSVLTLSASALTSSTATLTLYKDIVYLV